MEIEISRPEADRGVDEETGTPPEGETFFGHKGIEEDRCAFCEGAFP